MTTSILGAAKAGALCASLCMGLQSIGQTPTDPATDHWNRIVALNSLTREGGIPFYLKVQFQVFDLQGNAAETGTAEVWWSPKHRYEVISSPSWNETSAPGEADKPRTRQGYLIEALLGQIVQPVQTFKSTQALKFAEADKKFGTTVLRCISIDPSIPAPSPKAFCVEPSTDTLRVNSREGAIFLRSTMGKFHDTSVAIELSVTYGGIKAITGKVDVLKSIAPDDEHFKELSDVDSAARTTEASGSNGVLAGKILSKSPPIYPESAKLNHMTGTVVIGARISKEGKIASQTVIASPDASLAAAALDAVRTWKYQPYLLNGQPTEVDTFVVVNFNLRGVP